MLKRSLRDAGRLGLGGVALSALSTYCHSTSLVSTRTIVHSSDSI